MKRLMKKASKVKLYHFTNWKSFLGILESNQIAPQQSSGAGIGQSLWQEEVYDSKSYVTEERFRFDEKTRNNRENYFGRVFLTDSTETGEMYGKIGIEVEVSEEDLLPDNNDCPKCKTWQESLEKANQCAIKGSITGDKITRVVFLNYGKKTICEKQFSEINSEAFSQKELLDFAAMGYTNLESFGLTKEMIEYNPDTQYRMIAMDGENINTLMELGIDVTKKIKGHNPIEKAIQSNGNAIPYLLQNNIEIDEKTIEDGIKKTPDIIQYFANNNLLTYSMMYRAFQVDGNTIQYPLQANIEIDESLQEMALKSNPEAIMYFIQHNKMPSKDTLINVFATNSNAMKIMLRYGLVLEDDFIRYLFDGKASWFEQLIKQGIMFHESELSVFISMHIAFLNVMIENNVPLTDNLIQQATNLYGEKADEMLNKIANKTRRLLKKLALEEGMDYYLNIFNRVDKIKK